MELISRFRRLQNKHQNFQDISRVDWANDNDLLKLLANHWMEFAVLFPQISDDIIDEIELAEKKNNQKGVFLLYKMTSLTDVIPLTLFIDNLKTIIQREKCEDNCVGMNPLTHILQSSPLEVFEMFPL